MYLIISKSVHFRSGLAICLRCVLLCAAAADTATGGGCPRNEQSSRSSGRQSLLWGQLFIFSLPPPDGARRGGTAHLILRAAAPEDPCSPRGRTAWQNQSFAKTAPGLQCATIVLSQRMVMPLQNRESESPIPSRQSPLRIFALESIPSSTPHTSGRQVRGAARQWSRTRGCKRRVRSSELLCCGRLLDARAHRSDHCS